MLYNPSKQDELEHSFFSTISKTSLSFQENLTNLESLQHSISKGKKLDKEISQKLINETIDSRFIINPLKSFHEEKANSDILFSNPDMINLDHEFSKKF